jgi:hypothetical protein
LHRYNDLIESFCRETGIEDATRFAHDGLFEVEGIRMRVEAIDGTEAFRVLADLGPLPSDAAPQLRSAMLEANYDNDEPGLPVLSIQPDTQRAVLSIHLPIEETLSSGGLVRAIEDLVVPMRDWWDDVVERTVNPDLPATAAGRA